ncbi:MAG: hypothetical protein WBG86_23345 [Polyangiales bacterium]
MLAILAPRFGKRLPFRTEEMGTQASTRWFRRLHPAWVGLVGFALYARTIGFEFVNLDDPWLIRDNKLLQQPSLAAVWRILGDFSPEQRFRLGAEYLPVRDLSVMMDYAMYGDWIGGQHLTQVLLYAGTCAILASLVLALFEDVRLAWISGLLFTTHPVHVEVVSWLSERKGMLGSFLLGVSLLLATHYLLRGGRVRAVSACIVFLLAVAAKALTIAGIAAVVLIALWVRLGIPRARVLAFCAAYTVCGLVPFVPNVLVSSSLGVIEPYHGSGFVDTLLLFFQAHTQYLELMSYSGPYATQYAVKPGGAGLWSWLPGALVATAALAWVIAAILDRSRRTPAAFGVAWWLIFLAPVSHILVPVQNYAADRYLFLPSFGLLVVLAGFLARLPRAVGLPLTVAALAISCGWTVVQTPVWSSSERLLDNATRVTPTHALAWDKLAALAEERQEHGLAWSYATRGLEHSPGHWRLLHRQALLLAGRGDVDGAIHRMHDAASASESDLVYANLALLYLKRHRLDDARVAAENAVRLQPASARNQRALGIVMVELKELQAACHAFERAAEIDPFDQDNLRNLALCSPTPERGAP